MPTWVKILFLAIVWARARKARFRQFNYTNSMDVDVKVLVLVSQPCKSNKNADNEMNLAVSTAGT